MKAALVCALFGALFAVSWAMCPDVPYYSCIKEEKPTKCTAIEVCEFPEKEPCGDKYCEYPHVCASLKKKECIGFLALKEKCGLPQKVCKEIKKPCGDGACGAYQDCVKETVCTIKRLGYGRKLMGSSSDGAMAVATSTAIASGDATAIADAAAIAEDGGVAIATSEAIALGGGYYKDGVYYPPSYGKDCDKKCDMEKLVCEDKFTCVAKEPCVDIVVKKCVKSEYKEGIDVCHGGLSFLWAHLKAGEKCGDEYCGYGYDCAEVIIQKCKTKCGDSECDYGYECATEYENPECDKYTYLEAICKDVYEPVCVKLPPYIIAKFKPPCKTVFKCEKEDCVCGNDYCPYGFVCAVDYKKTCGGSYKPMIPKVVQKPGYKKEPVYKTPVAVPAKKEGDASKADALVLLEADETDTKAGILASASGDGVAVAAGDASNEGGSQTAGKAAAGGGQALAAGKASQKTGGVSAGKVKAEYGP